MLCLSFVSFVYSICECKGTCAPAYFQFFTVCLQCGMEMTEDAKAT